MGYVAETNSPTRPASFTCSVITSEANNGTDGRHILIKEKQIASPVFCDSKMKAIAAVVKVSARFRVVCASQRLRMMAKRKIRPVCARLTYLWIGVFKP